ncbi:MAG: GH92 family glycosyl hydrolase [Myxococcales bacterium]|nr:GH92 family glycosyl hydrolase [Myxococcales bacterium]
MTRSIAALACSGLALLAACSQPSPAPSDALPHDAAIDSAAPADVPSTDVPDTAVTDTGVDSGVAPVMPVAATAPFVRYVDPLLGTGGAGFNVGNTYPGPQVPFGLARPGPDTSSASGAAPFAHCAGYSYEDTFVDGFSQLHLQGAGIVDYGNLGVMPAHRMSPSLLDQRGRRLPFSHSAERASPGLYEVTLGASAESIRAELTATRNTALYRFAFSPGASPAVVLDTAHTLPGVTVSSGSIRWDSARRLITGHAEVQGGYSRRYGGVRLYFAAQLPEGAAPERATLFAMGALRPTITELDGTPPPGIVLEWPTTATTQTVELRIGLSFVDSERALANLGAEAAYTRSFETVRDDATAQWERRLSRLEATSRDPSVLRQLYTALYHAQQMPVRAQDSDGAYRALDGTVRTPAASEGVAHYTDWSLWDTFRAAHPLVAWLYPEDAREQFRSLVQDARDTGRIDRWALGHGMTGGMLGDSAAIVLADGLAWGLSLGDLRPAYTALRTAADGPVTRLGGYAGRDAVEEYVRLGYVPSESDDSSVSATLEYSYNDFALARMATTLGATTDATRFTARAGSYRALWDAAQQLLVPRGRAGTFGTIADPTMHTTGYVEGNAWHYLWYAPHDVDAMATHMGGRSAVLTRLEQFFDRSRVERRTPFPARYYWHSNEPCLHLPWLGSKLGRASASARWVRFATNRYYSEGPEGLPGNDDGGTMSAWYVFSALGLFPVAGTGEAWTGSPLLTRAVVHRAEGDWTMEAPDASSAHVFISSLSVRGTPSTRGVLPYAALTTPGVVRIETTVSPSGWGDL